jgi:hypothetical protein
MEGMAKAYTQISGFIRREAAHYERFGEVFSNTAFPLSAVQAALQDSGWTSIRMVSARNLDQPLEQPEQAGRVVVIAQRQNGKARGNTQKKRRKGKDRKQKKYAQHVVEADP